ncbi:MAG: Gfo/Idh/MocA family oxidoreductase [Prolixibacteraceae bacterium]|jgi:myo-inositol 2-dehydrogenase / D-chiro-inositol 1-dehydrogenase|nr:Gfo/Idh/MocA family oxidoreductase [Prolixibacteraceae bacterium]MBT6999891.1 Gfo/Idh/MocA family oxidoreductase [Prolixibacteraceae bacterium]MBT7396586.1 Gfo/Idh/MocA family oxidoreductase [Prolixibacteraceae bacterium]
MKAINRRKFLATSAAISAITILKPSTVFGTKANSAIRLGIIGCGNRGTSVISNMVNHTSGQIIAMADLFDYQLEKAKPRFDKLNTDQGGVAIDKSKIYQGSQAFQKLVNDSDVDAVLVSSPAYTHPDFLDAAVMAGKHVYCEKPVSPDVAGCKKVIVSGEKAKGKVSVAVGFQIRNATPYVEMAKRIRKGDIGEIVNVQLYYISSGSGKKVQPVGNSMEEFMIRNHFHFRELSGGIMLDQAIHMIDVCNWVLTENPENAIGNGNRKGEPDFGDTFTNYQAIYGYPDETNVSVHSTQFGPKFGDVCARFIGTKGFAEAHYGRGVFIEGDNPWDSGVLRGQSITEEQRASGVFSSSLHDANSNKVKAFINSIETGELINEAQSGANSTLSAILGRMSATSGKAKTWDEMYFSNQKFQPNLDLTQFDK